MTYTPMHLCDPIVENRTEFDGEAPYVFAEGGHCVAVMNDYGPEDQVSRELGRMFAAAPDLLEALKLAAVELEEASTLLETAHWPGPANTCAQTAEAARAAIAKAEEI